MGSSGRCPQSDMLREQWQRPATAEGQAQLIAHLDTCEVCQETLVRLAAGGEDLVATARQAGMESPPLDEPPPQLVAEILGKMADSTPFLTASSLSTLDFLEPPCDPAHVGRMAHYEVTDIVARGGMGVVLKAIDEKLGRVVCLKVLAPHIAASETARQRFSGEARAAAAIRSERVVTIHAVEEYRDRPYLVMEYIPGVSLQERLDRGGPLPFDEIVRIGIEMAEGLAAAHAQGLIHRDIKPGNVLLEEGSGHVKITDFGLARAVDDAKITREDVVAGTPEYMAPEQARGETVDHRADLFSLGSVLYTMCTGSSPFVAEGSLATLKCICEHTPPAIRTINPTIPRWFVELNARLLEKNSDKRLGSAAELVELMRRRKSGGPHWSKAARRLVLVAISAILLVLVGYLSGPWAGLWLANQGRLEITTDDPHLQVLVSQAGREVRTVNPQAEQRITLAPGNYDIQLAGSRGDLRATPDKLRLRRGATAQVVVRAEPGFVGLLRTFQGTHQVLQLACSPDGKLAVAACGQQIENGLLKWVVDCPLVLWDLESGEERRRFLGHTNTVRAVAFSPDGRRISSASTDQRARVWNAATGEALSGFETGPEGLLGMTFSADGSRLLGGGWDGIVRLWDMTSGKELCRCTGHAQGIVTLALSPDGRRGLSGGEGRWDNSVSRWFPGSDYTLRLWDLDACQELRRLRGHTAYVACVTFSADGRRALSGSEDKTIRLWEIATGDTIKSLTGHTGTIRGVAFSRDGRRALSAGEDATVRLWDLESGDELHRFSGHQGPIRCVVLSPNGRRALSGGNDGTVRLWQVPDP